MGENYIVIGLLNITALAGLTYTLFQNEIVDKRMKKFYFLGICATILVIVAELITTVFEKSLPLSHPLYYFANVVGFSLSPFIPLFLAIIFGNTYFKITNPIFFPFFINVMLTVFSPWTGYIFYVSPHQEYFRGPMFFFYVLTYLWSLMILVKATLDKIKHYQKKTNSTLIFLTVFVSVGTALQIIWPSLHTAWSCVTIALTLYYAYVCELSYKHDVLTEVFNRQVYESDIKRLESLNQATIILFDVNNFKKINDDFGHQYGDHCLKTIAVTIKEAFHHIGFCYRIGGDEFCVLSEETSEEIIQQALNNVDKKLKKYREKDANMPTVSFGFESYSSDVHNMEQVFQEADKQLYDHKRKHKILQQQNHFYKP